jgi:hypothetical protein
MDKIILTNGLVFKDLVLFGEIVPEVALNLPEKNDESLMFLSKSTKIIMKDIKVKDDLYEKIQAQISLQFKAGVDIPNDFRFDAVLFDSKTNPNQEEETHNRMYLQSVNFYKLDITVDTFYCEITLKD